MAKKVVAKKETGVALGIAGAVAAAIAGAYFLYGTKEGSKQRKNIKGWALKAKGEVLEKIENAKDLTEDSYNKTVSTVMKKYDKLKKDHGDEIAVVTKELTSYWNHLQKQFAKKAPKKSAKKSK